MCPNIWRKNVLFQGLSKKSIGTPLELLFFFAKVEAVEGQCGGYLESTFDMNDYSGFIVAEDNVRDNALPTIHVIESRMKKREASPNNEADLQVHQTSAIVCSTSMTSPDTYEVVDGEVSNFSEDGKSDEEDGVRQAMDIMIKAIPDGNVRIKL